MATSFLWAKFFTELTWQRQFINLPSASDIHTHNEHTNQNIEICP